MPSSFTIENRNHADLMSLHESLAEAVAEPRCLPAIPWHEEPDAPPCTVWRTCRRRYEILMYETLQRPW